MKIKESDINRDNYGHFTIDGKEYWLKLYIYVANYKYTLLRVEDTPKVLKIEPESNYTFTKTYKKRNKSKKIS